jgi:hypothetical protein
MKAKLDIDAVYITAETPVEAMAISNIAEENDSTFELGKTPSGKVILRIACGVDAVEYADDEEPVRGLADAEVTK